MKQLVGMLGVCAVIWAGLPAAAETNAATFGVRLFGAPVGRMDLASNQNGKAYAARGEFRTTGLIGLLARVRFTMSARGAGGSLKMRPRRYAEDLDTGYRTSTANVSFSGEDQRIDPLTGILAALLDRDAGAGCAYEGKTFDGTRTMSVRIRPARQDDNGDLTCTGRLVRLSGYTDEEMANATSFPFTIRYQRTGGRLVTTRAVIETIHGDVALVRR